MVFFKNDCPFTLFAVSAELIWDTFNRQVQLAWNSLTSPHFSGQLIMFTNLANIIFYTGQKKSQEAAEHFLPWGLAQLSSVF